jgi:hypothetical protein
MKALGPMEEKEKTYRSAERWNPVARTPLYINFKAEFSAFDRFFYFEDGQTLEEKQDDYVRRAEGKQRRQGPSGELQAGQPRVGL